MTVDRLADRRRQWAAVADAGGAAIADQIEADRIQMLLQASFGKVVGHHLRTRSKRRLYPRLRLHALFVCLLRYQARGHQHGRSEEHTSELTSPIRILSPC